MKKICSLNEKEMVSKKAVIISILTLSMVCAALASLVTVAQAKKGGTLWVNDPNDVPDQGFIAVGLEHFYVDRGVTYTIQIRDLPCCVGDEGDELDVKVSEGEEWGPETDFQSVVIQSGYDGKYVEFTWTVPEDAPICKTRVVLFRAHKENGWPESVCKGVYVTQGVLTEKPAHLHVIPEFAFGTALSIISLLSGLMVYSKFRRN